MAKIFDVVLRRNAESKLSVLRRQLNWLKSDLSTLESQSQEKIQKQLSRYLQQLNNKLNKVAFASMDKAQYADAVNSEKLQKYDVKQYMQHRAVNHGTVKKLFGVKKEGITVSDILTQHAQAVQQLAQKRQQYVEKLEAEKQAFIKKYAATDMDAAQQLYLSQKQQLTEKYNQKKRQLEEKSKQKIEATTKQLQSKIAKIQEKIDVLLATVVANQPSMDKDVQLSVKGLKMYFGGLKAVDDLTFDVRKGEIFGLIGPNGAGKTTVFNCITRFYDATAGDMYFCNNAGENVDLRRFKVHDVITQGITRTFQNVELVREISVLENLLVACTRNYRSNLLVQALGLPILKHEEAVLKRKALRILDFMGILSYANWLAFGLPYGILKKVEIARALMSDASLIIMDEPAAGLNDSETAELTKTIKKIRDEFGATILLVEHDMSLVMSVCDTVCAISFGKMLAIGTPSEIQSNAAVREAYLGVDE